MLPREDVRQVLTHALAFCCPSVYEPLGIVNLEAMACETAVVASAVGGIPEVVDDGDDRAARRLRPRRTPPGFEQRFAEAVNRLAADPAAAAQMGLAGRARAVERVRLGRRRGPDGGALRVAALTATLPGHPRAVGTQLLLVGEDRLER